MKQRNTVQRKLLLKAIRSLKCHPTAEDVYKTIVKEYPQISLATVYRNLNLMASNGGSGRFGGERGTIVRSGRASALSRKVYVCGKFMDVEAEYCREIDRMIEERTGYQISGHSLLSTESARIARGKREGAQR
jgi:Fe2+ or Zn2+ uptake regulation protein